MQQPSMAPGTGYIPRSYTRSGMPFSLPFRTNRQCPLLPSTNTTAHTSRGISTEIKMMIQCQGIDLLFLCALLVLLFFQGVRFFCASAKVFFHQVWPVLSYHVKSYSIFDVTASFGSNVKYMYLALD